MIKQLYLEISNLTSTKRKFITKIEKRLGAYVYKIDSQEELIRSFSLYFRYINSVRWFQSEHINIILFSKAPYIGVEI